MKHSLEHNLAVVGVVVCICALLASGAYGSWQGGPACFEGFLIAVGLAALGSVLGICISFLIFEVDKK